MPKIIENVREQLLAEARRQIAQRGYAQTTVRSVAGACSLGVGTVYNYFASKDVLIASFLFEDWKQYLDTMSALPKDQPEVLLRGIYKALGDFAAQNQALFSDVDAARSAAIGSSARHRMLRGQISAFILPLCELRGAQDPAFTSEFIAEALLCWSMEGAEFDAVYPILEKILK
jgi:AcrR family transcriptional regulator